MSLSSQLLIREQIERRRDCLEEINQWLQNKKSNESTRAVDIDRSGMASVAKSKGNAFVKNGEWDLASECFTQGIGIMEDVVSNTDLKAALLSNRGLCALKLSKWKECVIDCTESLSFKASLKTLLRRSIANRRLGKLSDSKSDLSECRTLCKNEPEFLDAVESEQALLDQAIVLHEEGEETRMRIRVCEFSPVDDMTDQGGEDYPNDLTIERTVSLAVPAVYQNQAESDARYIPRCVRLGLRPKGKE